MNKISPKSKSIMRRNITLNLLKDKDINVTFIRETSYLRPGKKTCTLKSNKVMKLNQEFIKYCRDTAKRSRKSIDKVIIDEMLIRAKEDGATQIRIS